MIIKCGIILNVVLKLKNIKKRGLWFNEIKFSYYIERNFVFLLFIIIIFNFIYEKGRKISIVWYEEFKIVLLIEVELEKLVCLRLERKV